MADRDDIDFTYSLTDRIFRLSLGELADFSGSQVRRRLLARASSRLSGASTSTWPSRSGSSRVAACSISAAGGERCSTYIRERRGLGVGVTLSSAQLAACRRHGLDVHLLDARQVDRERFGGFDAVASLGAFEHFCSPEDYRAGRQEEIYRAPLRARRKRASARRTASICRRWSSERNMIPAEQIGIDALRAVPPRDTDAWYLALLGRQFPGSWLPSSARAGHDLRRAALPPGIEGQRPAGLHRDDQPVEREDRRARA